MKKIQCFHCRNFFPPEEISRPDDKVISKKIGLCQDCLAGLLTGNIILDLSNLL